MIATDFCQRAVPGGNQRANPAMAPVSITVAVYTLPASWQALIIARNNGPTRLLFPPVITSTDGAGLGRLHDHAANSSKISYNWCKLWYISWLTRPTEILWCPWAMWQGTIDARYLLTGWRWPTYTESCSWYMWQFHVLIVKGDLTLYIRSEQSRR
jgi:hypothetical protein